MSALQGFLMYWRLWRNDRDHKKCLLLSPTWTVHLQFFIYYYNYRTYVGVCVTPFFKKIWCALYGLYTVCMAYIIHSMYGLYTVQSSCILYTKMDSVDKREKCVQRRRERERSCHASETAEEREDRLIKRRVSLSAGYSRLQ